MKILFKLLFLVFIVFNNINSRTLIIANIAKLTKKEIWDLTLLHNINGTIETGVTTKFDNPTPIGTPGISTPNLASTGSHMQQALDSIGYILNIKYKIRDFSGYLSKNRTLKDIVSSCLEFRDPKKCKGSYLRSPATYKKFTNNEVNFTFINKVHNTFWSCYTNGMSKMLEFKLILPEGREWDTACIIVDEHGAKIVTKPEMDKILAEHKCF